MFITHFHFLLYIFVGFLSGSSLIAHQKKALITGVTGQDGSYLAEFLLEKGYEVHGIIRPTTDNNKKIKIDEFVTSMNQIGTFKVHEADIIDGVRMSQIIEEVKPVEIYNLAAQSHVKTSFDMPVYTMSVDALSVFNILEAIKKAGMLKEIKFYQASTSELFGNAPDVITAESRNFQPTSPYGIAKLCAHWAVINYREAYGLFGCNGILFNHESPRRGLDFVTRKITNTAAQIKLGLKDSLSLGNLDAKRDWGYAKDYVEAMWLTLQQDKSDDYIIATGEYHTVRDFVTAAFKHVEIDIVWQGAGVDEVGIDVASGKVVVNVNPQFFRPVDHHTSTIDVSKLKNKLHWQPKTCFDDLVKMMVFADLQQIKLSKNKI